MEVAAALVGGGGGIDIDATACPVLNSSVLRCVLKTRTLQMNTTRTTIAHRAQHTTCDVHIEHGYLVAGPGFWCTSPESRRRCLGREESESR